MPIASDYPASSVGVNLISDINPYLRLGLQHNPFVAEDTPGVPTNLWIDRGYSTPPSPNQQQLVQIMGVKGAGKTSHLKHWQALTGGPYCYYPPGWGCVRLPLIAAIAYWDEANRIPLPFQALAFASASVRQATIVAGTHADLGPLARRCGLSVTTIHLSSFNTETLMDWANCRIEAARVPNSDCSLTLGRDYAAELAKSSRGSWREVGDRLHIWAAEKANACQR